MSFGSAVVITALPAERQAVLQHVENVSARTHPSGTIYDVGTFAGAGGNLDVAVAEIGAGNVGAAAHVERAIAFFDPDLLLFVGVAGGIKDLRLGDVLVASKVYGYEGGKEGRRFLARPEAYPLAHRLEQRARRVIAEGVWRHRIGSEDGGGPEAKLGPLAAGEVLLSSTDSGLFHFIQETLNDTLAIDMEGRGFFVGAHLNDSRPAAIVRGISDLIDDKSSNSDEHWQPVAAGNAAAMAFELLSQLSGAASPLDDGSAEAMSAITDRMMDAYYLNLPRLLSDPSALGLISESIEDLKGVGSWQELDWQMALRLRHLCEKSIEAWPGKALALEVALAEKAVGARVTFDGQFRTRNWRKFNPAIDLTGDLETDPHIYCDVGPTRVFFPIDPAWATTSTAQVVFNRGSISLSVVALLRDLSENGGLASPYVLAPPAAGRENTALLFGEP